MDRLFSICLLYYGQKGTSYNRRIYSHNTPKNDYIYAGIIFNFFTQLMRRCAGRQLTQIYSVG
jgi:hypothetical protein